MFRIADSAVLSDTVFPTLPYCALCVSICVGVRADMVVYGRSSKQLRWEISHGSVR